MVFKSQNENYCIACDWLQYSVRLVDAEPEFICPDGFRIEFLQGNNIFKYRAIVYRLDGLKYLTLLWGPYSRILRKDLMTVQVANPLLYMGGVHSSFRLLQEIVPCWFNSCGRVDICCDYQMDEFRYKMIRGLREGQFYVQGKSEGTDWWHKTNDVRGSFVHCLTWGSPNSEIKVKTYNKSRELGVSRDAIGEKPYISANWIDAGFDVEKVWRLEFSLKSSGQLQWAGRSVSLDDVANVEWLFDVFCSLYGSRFVVRKAMGLRHGHKNGDPRYYLLNLSSSDVKLKWSGSSDEVVAPNSRVTAIRKLATMIDSEICRCSPDVFQELAGSLVRLCAEKGYGAYFSNAYGRPVEAWLDERFAGCGEGCWDVVARPNELS